MPNRPRRPNYTPARLFCATPAYYTSIAHPPTRPGWYCCELTDGRIKHLTWKCGSFWDGEQECCDVSHWVELPEFVQRVLNST